MRKPILYLLVVAIALNFPLAACCPLSLPATAPTAESRPIPSLGATPVETQAPIVAPGTVARGATNPQGVAEITLEDRPIWLRVVDRKTPSTPLSGIELQVCEREGAFSIYAEDPQGNYFPFFLPPSTTVPKSGIIDMLPVEQGIDYAPIAPQVATEDPTIYPILAFSLTQDELAQFFEELSAGSAVILFFVSDTSAPDPDGPLHFTLHQGPFDHVYYAMISDQPEETSTGWVPVAYAAEREKPAFFPFLISAGVGLVLMKVGIAGGLAFAVNMILTTLEGAQVGVGPRPIVVPDLAGMTEDEVLGAIVGGPVNVVVRETGWCGEAVIGTVVAQHPFPDSEVYSWRDEPIDVIIYVYNGERGICGPVTVPDVVTGGLTVAEASQAIWDAGLIAVVEEAWHSDVPEGQIILQYPEAGTEVELGSTVSIRPSAGPGTPTPTHTPTPTPTPTVAPVAPTTGMGTVTGSYSYVLRFGQPDQGEFVASVYAAPDGLPAPEEVCGLRARDAAHVIWDRSEYWDSGVVQDDGTFRVDNVPAGVPLFVSMGWHDHNCPGLGCIIGAPLFTLTEGEVRDVGDLFFSCAFCCPCNYGHSDRCPL